MAQSTYPPDAESGLGVENARGVKVQAAVLPGMSDAVFIVTGPFTGDGSANAAVYGNGAAGWGMLMPDGGHRRLTSSGTGSNTINEGLSFAVHFRDGFLETAENSGVFSTAFGSGFPIRRDWRWSKDHFVLDHDSIVTAAPASVPAREVPAAPSAPPSEGTFGGRLQDAVVDATRTVAGSDGRIKLTLAPVRVSTACAAANTCAAGDGTVTADFTADAQVRTLYPVTAGGRDQLITGPLWPLAGIAESLWGVDSSSNSQIPALAVSPGYYQSKGAAPWYIPAGLHVSAFHVSRDLPVEITFHHGAVTEVAVLAPRQ
ncbi:hypothetical protein [Streptomyces tropicalis]|uniref:Uncharacterized protein n=1 Tax=Streptomyces tropicalis TaxID=3034234 RepID=A0ABT6AFA6_9ACTN|nr:hypothetical protein [Streptomyces tropicalis]MDF3302480.1 hypothetical protein [Streptomyces tropicalis]